MDTDLKWKYKKNEKERIEHLVDMLTHFYIIEGKGTIKVYQGSPNTLVLEPEQGSCISRIGQASYQAGIKRELVCSSPEHTTIELEDRRYLIYFKKKVR